MVETYLFWDDETANSQQMICQVGYVLMDSEGNRIGEPVCQLINPESGFDWHTQRKHHITEADVADSPTFGRFWEESGLLGLLTTCVFVAHNANGADVHHIRKSLSAYGMEMPGLRVVDTMREAQQHGLPFSLPGLCGHYGVKIDRHHDALIDAMACADVFWRMAAEFGMPEPTEWVASEGPQSSSHGGRRHIAGPGHVDRSDKTIEEVLAEAEAKGLRGNIFQAESLEGLRVKVSGTVPGYNRDAILAELKGLGLKATAGVPNKSTEYLAIGDGVGQSKLAPVFDGKTKAKIITVGELLEVIDRAAR